MEQKKKTIMFYEICRICLDERGICDIFERDGLSEDVHSCTGVKVLPADNLPQRICENCLSIVNKAKLLSIVAKRNEYHLKSLFLDQEQDKSKDTTKEVTETVTSMYFDNEKPGLEKVSAIENFLTVRKDLFESSVTEDSLIAVRENQPDSSAKPSAKPVNRKRLKSKDGDTDNKCKESSMAESQQNSSAKPSAEPVNKKSLKSKDCNIDNKCNDSSMSSAENQKVTSSKPDIIKKIIREDGNTDYQCNVCSKKFDKWKKLYLHNRLHNKNYACPLDMCGKKFSTKGDVEKHIRTHTGEKPYQCDICDKGFAQRGTLRVHKENVHGLS